MFCKIDLRLGYHHIRLKLEYNPMNGFRMRYSHYEYSIMPLAVSNAPSVFMEYMNRIFHPYLDQFVVVIIKDVLIYLKLDMDHAENMRFVLQTLKDNKFYAKLSKCKFWMT